MKAVKVILVFMFFALSNAKASGIVDSISDYTYNKLAQLHLQNKEYARLKQYDKINYNLVLGETDWEIIFTNSGFHYYRGQPAQGFSMGSKTSDDFQELMDDYNTSARIGDTGIFIYSVVYFNFPMYFVQEKIKNFQANGEDALFTQLEKIGAVKNDWYYQSKYLAANILKNCVLKSLASGVFHDAVFCFSMTTSTLTSNDGKARCFMFNMAAPVGTKATQRYGEIESSITAAIKKSNGNGLTDHHYSLVKTTVESARCAFQNNCSLDVSGFHTVAKSFYENNNLTTQGKDRIHLINATNLLQSMSPDLAKACIEENNRLVSLAGGEYTGTTFQNRPPGSVGGTEAFIQEFIKAIDKLYKNGSALSRQEILNYGFITCNFLKYTGVDLQMRISILKKLMEGTCPDQINVLTYANPVEYCEKIAVNLITSVPPSQQDGFLTRLRDDGLLPELSSRLNNSTFGAFGTNNYTAYMNALLQYCYNVYGSIIQNGSEVSDLCVIKWSERFFAGNDLVLTTQPGNKIKIIHSSSGLPFPTPSDYNASYTCGAYDWVGVCVISNSTLLNVTKGTTVWVPAIYLEWLYDQKSWSDLKVGTKVLLDAVSVLTGIGGIYRAASTFSKIWCGFEIAVGTTDLALNNQSVRDGLKSALGPDGQSYLESWDYFSLMVNATSLYKGITKFDEYAEDFRKIFGSKKNTIREQVPPADYDRMKLVDEELAKRADEFVLAGSALVNSLSPELRSIHNRLVGAGAGVFEQGDVIRYVTINGNEFAKIEDGVFSVTYSKGSIPSTNTYLDETYITNHKSKFKQDGAAFIVVKSWTEGGNPLNVTLPPRKFVGLLSEMDVVISKYKSQGNDWTILRDELNLGPTTNLELEEIYYVKIDGNDSRFDFDVPNGNEGGAIVGEWVPGGYTKNGTAEAALVGSETIFHNKSIIELLNNFEGKWEKIK